MSRRLRKPRPPHPPRKPGHYLPVLAKLLTAASFLTIAAGVWVLLGLGWGLVALGILGAAYGLTLVDVDDDKVTRR